MPQMSRYEVGMTSADGRCVAAIMDTPSARPTAIVRTLSPLNSADWARSSLLRPVSFAAMLSIMISSTKATRYGICWFAFRWLYTSMRATPASSNNLWRRSISPHRSCTNAMPSSGLLATGHWSAARSSGIRPKSTPPFRSATAILMCCPLASCCSKPAIMLAMTSLLPMPWSPPTMPDPRSRRGRAMGARPSCPMGSASTSGAGAE